MTTQELLEAFEEAGYTTKQEVAAMLAMAKLTLASQAKKQAAVAVRASGQTAMSQANAQASALEQSAAADELALQALVASQQTP